MPGAMSHNPFPHPCNGACLGLAESLAPYALIILNAEENLFKLAHGAGGWAAANRLAQATESA